MSNKTPPKQVIKLLFIMKKLFRKNEAVRFKNEEQKNQLLDIAVKYGIKWKSGKEPFGYNIDNGDCINFSKCEFLYYGCNKSYEESNYKVISTKKFLKRFEEKQLSGWYKGNREEDKRLYYINREENTFFGIDGNNDKWIVRNDASDITNVIKATNEEVLPRLIEEANKRGLVNGAEIKCLTKTKDYIHIPGKFNSLKLEETVIMHNGIWAEVVEEIKPNFKPVFMKCTQDQFDKMRNKLESVGCKIIDISNFNDYTYLATFFRGKHNHISNIKEHDLANESRTEAHTEAEFLEACGYVEEVCEPKVGDFGLFWDDDFDIDEQNIMGYIKEVRINNSFKTICNEIYDNFTPLPQETEDIYNRIKNK